MKKKLLKLKEYAQEIKNYQPLVFDDLMNKKVNELMKGERYRTIINILIGSLSGVSFMILIKNL